MKRLFRPIENRKWDAHKEQHKFEVSLEKNGFVINGIKELISKTEYLTTKDEIQDVFIFNTDDNANQAIITCLRSHDIHMENIRLKQEIANAKKNA
jgi:hypothetical protein